MREARRSNSNSVVTTGPDPRAGALSTPLRIHDTATVKAAPLHIGTKPVRPVARGKFIYIGSEKLWVRGVTYGAFRPDEQQREYQDVAAVERDFAQMAAAGLNAVRIPHTTA